MGEGVSARRRASRVRGQPRFDARPARSRVPLDPKSPREVTPADLIVPLPIAARRDTAPIADSSDQGIEGQVAGLLCISHRLPMDTASNLVELGRLGGPRSRRLLA